MITPEPIEAYARAHSDPEHPVLIALAEETRATMKSAQMLCDPLVGGLLRTLVRLTGARRVLEIGTFTGYSALWMASALPADGELITCDVDPASTALAKKHWALHPAGERIRLELGDATETLSRLTGVFDLAFIDADKENYQTYWDRVITLLRPGGAVAVDNVLWSGKALAPDTPVAQAITDFNTYAAQDPRVERVLLPVRDGVLLAVKR